MYNVKCIASKYPCTNSKCELGAFDDLGNKYVMIAYEGNI